jgi:hypothetical protein
MSTTVLVQVERPTEKAAQTLDGGGDHDRQDGVRVQGQVSCKGKGGRPLKAASSNIMLKHNAKKK